MKNKAYIITNQSERVAVEESSRSIDNNGIYFSNYFVYVSNKGIIVDETINTSSTEEHSEFNIDIEREFGSSDTNQEILDFFEKYNIIDTNGYGIQYKHYYEELIYSCKLTENQMKEIEKLGWEIEEL